MRIVNLAIGHWRNFSEIEMSPAPDSSLVCVTGDNGTGKSNILELLATAAVQLGLSPTVVQRRGELSQEPHSYSVTLRLNETPSELLGSDQWDTLRQGGMEAWDQTITLRSEVSDDGSVTDSVPGTSPTKARATSSRERSWTGSALARRSESSISTQTAPTPRSPSRPSSTPRRSSASGGA